MGHILIMTIFHFVLVSAQEKTYFTFTEGKKSLSECIQDELLTSDGWKKNVEIAKLVSETVANMVSGETKEWLALDVEMKKLFTEMRNEAKRGSKKYFTNLFRDVAITDVEDCAEVEKSILEEAKHFYFGKNQDLIS